LVYYKLQEPSFLCKYCLLHFISNSLLNSWLLCTFLEKGISPMNAFYFRSGCFFPSSKILNSDYQTGFNELRVGAFLSCDLPNTQCIPLSWWVAITVLLGCIPMLILEWLKGKVWLIFFKSMSPSPWLVLDVRLCTNKQINRGSKMSTMTQPLRILEAVKWVRAKKNQTNKQKKHFCRLVSWAENPVKNIYSI